MIFARSDMPSSSLNIPYFWATAPCGQKSERSRVFFIPRCCAHAFLEGVVSTLTPTAIVLVLSKYFLFSSNDCICCAQTEVHASGWNDNSIFFPLKSESLNGFSL